MKRLLPLFASLTFAFSSHLIAQTLYVPSSVTNAGIPGSNPWFGPGCCDLSHTRDNSAMSGVGLAAVHEPCDNSAYFNEFGISIAYSYAQGWSLTTVLPGFDMNFAPAVASLNGIVIWNTCYVLPMQGHYQYDANFIGFNAIVYHSGGTTNITGLTLANSLSNCAAQQVMFPTTYTGVTRVRVIPTTPHINFRDPSTGGDRNIYVSEVRGLFATILPVEVTNMYATADKEFVDVHWDVSKETGNHHFNLERSLDHGATWEDIGMISSYGDGTDHPYDFRDYHPVPGIIAYRLSQTDINGTTQTVRSATVQYWGNDFAVIYPVPVEDELNIKLLQEERGQVTIRIYDMTGNLVTEFTDREIEHFDLTLDLSELETGRYFVICSDNKGNVLKKAILKEKP